MTRMTSIVGVACAAVLAATTATGQETTEAFSAGTGGAAVYKTYCATCHGVEARGDGPLSQLLRHAPPDLTLLAKRNAGKFDDARVHRMVDGRDPIKGHGGADMPVWGDAFRRTSDGYSEKAVKERIEALVLHLRSVQRK